MILEDYLEQDARLYPDKTAIVCGAETCSYLQLYERCLARSAHYADRRGQVVLFRASPTIGFVVDYFAIHIAGAVAAPMEKDTRRKSSMNWSKNSILPLFPKASQTCSTPQALPGVRRA